MLYETKDKKAVVYENRVEIGQCVYPISGLTFVSLTERIVPAKVELRVDVNALAGIALLTVGAPTLMFGLLAIGTCRAEGIVTGLFATVFGLFLLLLTYAAFHAPTQKPRKTEKQTFYTLILGTAGGDIKAYSSADKDDMESLKLAISSALLSKKA